MTAFSNPVAWKGFCLRFVLAGFLLGALIFALIAFLDPYGVRAGPGKTPSAIMDLNQRFMYPQIVRSRRFDSAVFGTSTVRLFDPKALDEVIGGHFVNLGLNAGTPWEQMQLADLFLRTVPRPKTLIFGLDQTWCAQDADEKTLTFRPFPPWLYDDSRLNDYAPQLNLTTLEIAGRLLLHKLGFMPERIRDDGFEQFLPDDVLFDLERARRTIAAPTPLPAPNPPFAFAKAERQALRFPALIWLKAVFDRLPATTQVTVAFMPIHSAWMPTPGTQLAAVEEECKARFAALGQEHNALVIDFRLFSNITRDDANFWDPVHYRIGIAAKILEALQTARQTSEDADGFYKILNSPDRRQQPAPNLP